MYAKWIFLMTGLHQKLTFCLLSFLFFAVCAGMGFFPDIPQAQSSPETGVAAYRQFLNTLDRGEVQSISAARAELEKQFSTPPENTAVAAFRMFKEFHAGVVQAIDRTRFWQTSEGIRKSVRDPRNEIQAALNEIMSGSPGYISQFNTDLLNGDPMGTLDARDETFRKRLEEKYGATLKELHEFRQNGIRFHWGEGDWYAGVDEEYLVRAAAFLRGDYGEFLRFQAREGKARIAHDAALEISWDELRERIIRYESFMEAHPELPETKMEVRRDLDRLVSFYLTGIENTRAYDLYGGQGTGALAPELRKSYERFLAKNKESAYHPIIHKVYEIGKRHDFTFSKELRTYLEMRGYGFFLGMYPEGK